MCGQIQNIKLTKKIKLRVYCIRYCGDINISVGFSVSLTDPQQTLIADKEAVSNFGRPNDFHSFLDIMVISEAVSIYKQT